MYVHSGLLTILVKSIAIFNTDTFSNYFKSSNKARQNCMHMLGIHFECLPSNLMHLVRWLW